jgi:hypothetical protein
MKGRRREPTLREVRAHGPKVCDPNPEDCMVCTLLSRQMVDSIREIQGKRPIYVNR